MSTENQISRLNELRIGTINYFFVRYDLNDFFFFIRKIDLRIERMTILFKVFYEFILYKIFGNFISSRTRMRYPIIRIVVDTMFNHSENV